MSYFYWFVLPAEINYELFLLVEWFIGLLVYWFISLLGELGEFALFLNITDLIFAS